MDEYRFRSVLSRFASGVTVVTAVDVKGVDHGITVSAFCSLSLEPPLVLVCIDHQTVMHGVLGGSSAFAINVLAVDQEDLARKFSDPDNNRFDGTSFARGDNGAPALTGAAATLECAMMERYEGGDHTIFVGRVETAESSDAPPLLYYRGGYARLER
ncbi:MAG: flavin reductase family protein [Gemmatimonadota bacterium]|nr:flavin reductase family protein [Gemmatimonadota bacterium]